MPTGIYIRTEKHKQILSNARKGIIFSEEHKKNLSKSATGRRLSKETITKMKAKLKGRKAWNKGIPLSKEAKLKLSKARLGIHHTEETKKKIANASTGRKHGGYKLSAEIRKRISEGHKGEKSYLWRGGITPKQIALRNSFDYEEWRKKVFERDNYTCQHCGQIGEYLHADHIKRFSDYPGLRFEVSNGRTLCVPCHYHLTWNKPISPNSKWGHRIGKKKVDSASSQLKAGI